MTLGTILVLIAGLLVIVGLAMGFAADAPAARYRRSYLLLAIAVLLICVALCIGVEPFVRI